MADIIEKIFSKKERNSDTMKTFGYRLRNQFNTNEAYRRPKELEWLESLRQYKGLYDADVKIEAENSKVYPKLTRSKLNIVLSRLHEMLFPETDRNWGIKPTPEPKMAREVVKMIALGLVRKDPITGQVVIPTAEQLNFAIQQFAAMSCEKMASVIEDQLVEMDYPGETKQVLRSGLMFGTGIMKGPLINKRTKRIWEQSDDGEYEEAAELEDVPFFQFIRIWDWYPDMTVTELDKAEGSFERHQMTKHDLRTLMNREDFYPEMIEEYLRSHPNGDYVPKNWEVDLQVIEVEASTGGKRVSTAVTGETNDATRSSNRQIGKKYEVLEYWGFVDGSDLQACGVNVEDVTLEYGANVWLLGSYPIKATLFEGALDQYKLFYYEKDETSLYGEGLARIMRHSQIAVSAGARMILDNSAVVSGPQVEINYSLMAPDTDLNSFYPRKQWFREGRGVEAQYPALRSLQFDSHIEELIGVVNLFKQFADEETTLPTWMISQTTNNETAQATSGRMAAITISIKDIVKNFDSFTEKTIRDLYKWNMEFNPRQDIKGDYNVIARGVSSLVMKEIRMQALTQLRATLQPEDMIYFERRDFLKELVKAHDLDIRVKTEVEVDLLRQKQEASRERQLMYATAEADIQYRKAQAMAQLTKAKDKNVDATIKASSAGPQGEDPRLVEAELAKKQAEVEKERQKMVLEDEKSGLERQKSLQDMRHAETEHNVSLMQQHEKHKADLETKKATTEHGMKLKEKVATMRAKQKPKQGGGKR